VVGHDHVVKAFCPGGLKPGDLPVDRAIGIMRARHVPRTDEQLIDDLATGEEEGLFQDVNAIATRKALYYQRKSFSNRQAEIISNTKANA
jgi:hypothetical protein